MSKRRWRLAERRRFLARLAEGGDPAAAAEAVSRPLDEAYRLREDDADFGAGWARALDIAWELVDARVMARLLASEENLPAAARIVDSKLALAILQRRGMGPVTKSAASAAGVAQLREEIRLMAGEQPD
ncbi:hypothetical protein [Polymorphobacter sp.]|uniref:hypothetical protein n=1 Tax=Polymorphobacter sp. TaxID=1909290 RepID=UPI003F6EF11C